MSQHTQRSAEGPRPKTFKLNSEIEQMSRDALDQWEELIPEESSIRTTDSITQRPATTDQITQRGSEDAISTKQETPPNNNDGFRPPRVYSFSNPRDQPAPKNSEVLFTQSYTDFLGKVETELSFEFPSGSKMNQESLSMEQEHSMKRLLDENAYLKEFSRSTLEELNKFLAIEENQKDEASKEQLDLLASVSEENASLKELLRTTTENFEDAKETHLEDNACLTEIIRSTEDELQTTLEIKKELIQQLADRDDDISKKDEEITNLLLELQAKEQEIEAKEIEMANFEPVVTQESTIIEEFRRSMECMICLETIRLPLFACPCCAKVLGCLQCVKDLRDCPNCRAGFLGIKQPLRGLESLRLILTDQCDA